MKDSTIPACLIVDDFPFNAASWRRVQVEALGYRVVKGPWAKGWRSQRRAAFMPVKLLEQFADLVEEFGLRGKFTVLPCPGGWGRMDEGVRMLAESERRGLLEVVRRRIAPHFSITPEGLTHTLALDLETGGFLPHCETAWLTHLAQKGRFEDLCAYFRRAWEILANLGFHPLGSTVGGMEDVSGVGDGASLINGGFRDVLASALLCVQAEFGPAAPTLFLYTGSPPVHPVSRATLAPEVIFSEGGRSVYEIHSLTDDPLLGVLGGRGDILKEAEPFVSRDLTSGSLIESAESGRGLTITVHSNTLVSLGTGLGLSLLRELLTRLQSRYGQKIVWMDPLEMIAAKGVGEVSQRS